MFLDRFLDRFWMPKWSQNGPKIDKISIKNRNTFLIALLIDILMFLGAASLQKTMISHRRSLKNHERRLFAKRSPTVPKMSPTLRQNGRQNNQKSDQTYDRENASFLDRFLMPKCSQNGGQNGTKKGEKGFRKVLFIKMASKRSFWIDV